MQRFLTPAQKVAHALRRAEIQLRNWHDDPESPHQDIDKMIATLGEVKALVQAHVLADVERTEEKLKRASIGAYSHAEE